MVEEDLLQQHFSVEDDSDADNLLFSDDILSESNGAEATNEQQYTCHELTAKQWIIDHTSHGPKHIKGALHIALKLTDLLIEAEKEEQNGGHGNSIPLNDIRTEKILIQTKRNNVLTSEGEQQDCIEAVSIQSSKGGNLDTGTVLARLYAVGNVLYELCTGDEAASFLSNDAAVEIYESANHHPKKSRGRLTFSGDKSPDFITRLESEGFPLSVCGLVKDLLDCGKEPFCGDDAYYSFLDLKQDLCLMINDPSRFLYNIQVTNGLPTLEICDKLYGRETEEVKLDQLYQQNIKAKDFNGVIISGGAGVGKSRLAMHIQTLTNEANGYFCAAKFQQNNMHKKPLVTIGELFTSLCDRFAEDASPLQVELVSDELTNALGSQAGLLAGVVPSLSKLMPSCRTHDVPSSCVNAPSSMRYLFAELLYIISSHSKRHISLLIDDIQFADQSSLVLLRSLLFRDAKYDSSVFFAFCHRDNEPEEDRKTFDIWLSSISIFCLEKIILDNLTANSVNILISDALHLSPRIIRPLSDVLYQKTAGNPLFLRQLIASLTRHGYIYVDLSQPRWAWDLRKIADQEISESVLALLMIEMKRLPSDFQLGLKVASCLGSCIQNNVLDILSEDLGIDLLTIMQQVSERGYMKSSDDGVIFTFTHDKIQQAAYELMSEQQQQESHMQYGLALYSRTLNDSSDDNELVFTAINQINHGGELTDPTQRSIIARLNLKAGKLSIVLSDYMTALSLFEHGISYLGDDKWASEYKLTLNLFDEAAVAASVLNKNEDVASYTKQLVAHAKSFDDSLNCLVVAAKSYYQASLVEQSMASCFKVLSKLGEEPLRDMGDTTLKNDLLTINRKLRGMSDEAILNIQENSLKKYATIMKLYAHLGVVLGREKPSLLADASLRMLVHTMSNGLVPSSCGAFLYYGAVLVATGNINDGCRYGRIALKLVEKETSVVHKSGVIAGVYLTILWTSQPLQSIVEAHRVGRKVGQQTGDVLHTRLNWYLSIITDYLAGGSLTLVLDSVQDYIMSDQKGHAFLWGATLLYHQTRVLKEGKCALDKTPPNEILTEGDVQKAFPSPFIQYVYKFHQLVRAYLFRQLDDVCLHIDMLDDFERNKHQLRPICVCGLYFEGLASFLLARQTKDSEHRMRWIEEGENVLTKMRYWSEHSSWNWESKMTLLEAERMYTLGSFDQALLFYERAIRSANEHKFINDEAIASELAGLFFCERGMNDIKTEALLLHSVQSYKTWGAFAVASRVETFIASKCGSDCMFIIQQWPLSIILASVFASNKKGSSSKKRQEM